MSWGERKPQVKPPCRCNFKLSVLVKFTHPFAYFQDLQGESQSCARHHGGREVHHIVVDHGELQQVFSQSVLLSRHLWKNQSRSENYLWRPSKLHQKSCRKPRRSSRHDGGTAGGEAGPAETSAPSGWSSPCLGSGRWCRRGPSRRQSRRSPVDTFPRTWRPETWRTPRPAAAASWGLGGPVGGGGQLLGMFLARRACNTDQVAGYLKKAVDHSYGHVHRLLQQTKLEVHLHQPVDEDGPHVSSNLLTLQIAGLDALLSLQKKTQAC